MSEAWRQRSARKRSAGLSGQPPKGPSWKWLAAAGAAALLVLLGVIVDVYNSRHELAGEIHDKGTEEIAHPRPCRESFSTSRRTVGTARVWQGRCSRCEPQPQGRSPRAAPRARNDPAPLIAPRPAVAPLTTSKPRPPGSLGQTSWHAGANDQLDRHEAGADSAGRIHDGKHARAAGRSWQNGRGMQTRRATYAPRKKKCRSIVSRLRSLLAGDDRSHVGQFKKFVEATKYVTEAERFGFGNSRQCDDD